MINLNDDDVVGLVTIPLEMIEVILESLVRKGLFGVSDLEYLSDDVRTAIKKCVRSETAILRLFRHMDKMEDELFLQVEMDQRDM